MDVGNAHVSSGSGVPDAVRFGEAQVISSIPLRPGIRKQLGREEWEALRPLIEQLYIKERKTYPEVRDILRDEHDFEPT